MDKKKLLLVLGLISIFTLTIFILNQGISTAQECRIVRLWGQAFPEPSIEIEPKTLVVSKGACVIWSNWVRAEEVSVVFTEGKKCLDMTEAPTGFKMDLSTQCYVANFIKLGQTSSLRFPQDGTFKYEVIAGKNLKAAGEIIVQN